MQAMKGATMALGSMNRTMNLPALQRIAMEFERENDIMEQRQEMMDDAIDDAMDVGVEEEGDEVVERVLEEIGVDLNQAVSSPVCCIPTGQVLTMSCSLERHPQGSIPTTFLRLGWLRRRRLVAPAEVAILRMMIFKLVLTASESDGHRYGCCASPMRKLFFGLKMNLLWMI